MTAMSEIITGRRANAKAFRVCQEGHKSFVVGAYTTREGTTHYADAVYIGPREKYKGVLQVRPKTKCLYRVIVTPKHGAK